MMFEFVDISRVEGKELDLIISQKKPANPSKDHFPTYLFDIVIHGSNTIVGHCVFRVGHNDNTYYGGNVGYSVEEEHRGHHYAAKACLLMIDIVKMHNLDYLIITCDPDNIASIKTCEYLGAEFVEIAKLPEDNEMYRKGKRMKCIYRWKMNLV